MVAESCWHITELRTDPPKNISAPDQPPNELECRKEAGKEERDIQPSGHCRHGRASGNTKEDQPDTHKRNPLR